MNFVQFVASVRRVAHDVGLRLPMAKLNDAISIAHFNKPYASCVAAERAGKLGPLPDTPPFVSVAAQRYAVDPSVLLRAIRNAPGAVERQDAGSLEASRGKARVPLALNERHSQQRALWQKAERELYVSFAPSAHVGVGEDGILSVEDTAAADPAFRLAIARGADGLVLLRLWPSEPPHEEVADAIKEGVQYLESAEEPCVLGAPANLCRSPVIGLVSQLLDRTVSPKLRGAKALVALIRYADRFPVRLAESLRFQAEGPPTLAELEQSFPSAPGWIVLPWDPPLSSFRQRTPEWLACADRITLARGRDPRDGWSRAWRNPSAAPKNTHAAAVPEADPLDSIEATLSQNPQYYDYVVRRLASDFRKWQSASDAAQKGDIEQDVVRWILEEMMVLKSRIPGMTLDMVLFFIVGNFGHKGVWAHWLYQWLADAFAAGLFFGSKRIQTCWLRIGFAPVEPHSVQPGIRRLPELPMLLESLAGEGYASRLIIDQRGKLCDGRRQDAMEDEATRRRSRIVRLGLLALSGTASWERVGRVDRSSKAGVLGTPVDRGTLRGDWWFPMAALGAALPAGGDSQRSLRAWRETANASLEKWGAVTRIIIAELS